MAQLNMIIYSVMRDLILAQHEANIYSASLKEVYSRNGVMQAYSLPTITLGDIEMDIRYSVNSENEQVEQYEVNYSEVRDRLEGISGNTTKAIVASFVSYLKEQNYSDSDVSLFVSNFINNKVSQSNFSQFLSRKIYRMLNGNLSKLLDEDGDFDNDYLNTIVVRAAKEEFLNNKEFIQISGSVEGLDVIDSLVEQIRSNLSVIIPKITKDINCKRVRSKPSVDIIINSEELAKLPEECLHSFRFKIKPASMNMLIAEHDTNH